jgi:hypothetical protein
MTKLLHTLILFCVSIAVYAQHFYPKKLDNCATSLFCVDCGDIKANVDKEKYEQLVSYIKSTNDLNNIKGSLKFQILVDSTGKGCVLSHTDVSDNVISKNIVTALNSFDGYIPAKSKDKTESRTSFNMSFVIKDGTISGRVERVDMNAFEKSFDNPKAPEIYNKTYVYKNQNLKSYKMTVWNTKNSNLPKNRNDHITIDKNGIIWLTNYEGLTKFIGNKFESVEQNVTEKGKYFPYQAIETDNENTKWVFAKNNIYSYDDKKWKVYDSTEIGIKGAYNIINNPKTAEVFFCSDNGLSIYQNGKWKNINKTNLGELPSNRIYFAKRDSKNRLWIGTFSGSVMVDENGKAVSFNDTETILKDKCISAMDEDENGNLYFGLFEYARKTPPQANKNEGIGIRYTDGTMKQFTTSNSGMPFNHTTSVLYDKNEKVLWISTDRAGLVRYDLKDGWENYHSDNSEIPTSYISAMTFDKNGVLYVATWQGLVKVERK